jgi:hypothetical protein
MLDGRPIPGLAIVFVLACAAGKRQTGPAAPNAGLDEGSKTGPAILLAQRLKEVEAQADSDRAATVLANQRSVVAVGLGDYFTGVRVAQPR